MYPMSSYEKILLHNETDINRLTFLERKTQAKIQYFYSHKIAMIRSIQDEFHLLRIVMMALLIKIFREPVPENQQRLSYLKNIIYSSKLKDITQAKGVLKEELHKSIAVQFQKHINKFEAQEYVFSMFNNTPFFDEILLKSVIEKIGQESYKSIDSIQVEIKKYFDFKFQWNKNKSECTNDELHFIREDHNIYILSEKDFGQHFSQDSSEPSVKEFQAISEGEEKKYLYKTVTIQKSDQSRSKNKQNYDYLNRQSTKSIAEIESFDQKIKIKEPKKKNIFWSIFCCGND